MRNLKKIGIVLIILFSIIGILFGGLWIALITAETPIFELPVHNLNEVTGVQVFHDNRSTDRIHHGFDFALENNTEIFAPISGKITGVEKKQMFNGLWIIDVKIKINIKWSMYIAFEPDTDMESVINAQMLNITVKKGDKVVLNQSLGMLNPVPGQGSLIFTGILIDMDFLHGNLKMYHPMIIVRQTQSSFYTPYAKNSVSYLKIPSFDSSLIVQFSILKINK